MSSVLTQLYLLVFFFFFQAEDGIRDTSVTGVQTCALPISRRCPTRSARRTSPWTGASRRSCVAATSATAPTRSEERRVGKECRSRWRPEQEKKTRTQSIGELSRSEYAPIHKTSRTNKDNET